MRDDNIDIAGMIFGIMFLICCVLLFSYFMGNLECGVKSKKQGLVYDFGLIQGCMVREPNGKWIDYNRYRVLER